MGDFTGFDPDLADVFFKLSDAKVSIYSYYDRKGTPYSEFAELDQLLNTINLCTAILAKIQAMRNNPEAWKEPTNG